MKNPLDVTPVNVRQRNAEATVKRWEWDSARMRIHEQELLKQFCKLSDEKYIEFFSPATPENYAMYAKAFSTTED